MSLSFGLLKASLPPFLLPSLPLSPAPHPSPTPRHLGALASAHLHPSDKKTSHINTAAAAVRAERRACQRAHSRAKSTLTRNLARLKGKENTAARPGRRKQGDKLPPLLVMPKTLTSLWLLTLIHQARRLRRSTPDALTRPATKSLVP